MFVATTHLRSPSGARWKIFALKVQILRHFEMPRNHVAYNALIVIKLFNDLVFKISITLCNNWPKTLK